MSTKEEIRYALVSLFEETGKKKSSLADHLNVSRPAVTNWTSGANSIDMDYVPGICDFFGITIDEFFGRSEKYRVTAEEERLLSLYRSMNEKGRARLMEEAMMMAKSGMFAKSEDHRVSETA